MGATRTVFFGVVTLCCAAAASADFTGYSVEGFGLPSGHGGMNIYATFSNVGDRVVNGYRTNITTNAVGGFVQSAANPFWKPGTQNKLTSDDSWVTIDTNPNGSGNSSGSTTACDPNFVNFDDLNESTDFSFIESSGNGAGWYNSQPATQWGYANIDAPFTGPRVLLAHFVRGVDVINNEQLIWNVRLTVTLAGQTGSTGDVGMGTFNFIWAFPGPGAMGLLCVAGLFSHRRREE